MRALGILLAGLIVSSLVLGLRWTAHRNTPSTPPTHVANPEVSPARGLRRGESLPEARLIDHDGNAFRLSDLRGKVIVLGFIYTHCAVPSMCPMVTARLIEVRDRLKEEDADRVEYLLVSFDPDRDGAARLREYASRFTTDLDSLRFASGPDGEVRALTRALNTFYRKRAGGVFDHNVAVSIVDPDGLLRDDLFGTDWKVEELVGAIRKAHR